jgi:20S proteasome alpha/beta subunit
VTTVATDGLGMAADGRAIVDRTIITDERIKIHQLGDGRIIGCSGQGGDIAAFRAWLEAGGEGRLKVSRGAVALVLDPDGSVTRITDDGVKLPVPAPMACGSGMDFAIGAMEAGATPEEAVEIACARDPGSGGKIVNLDLEQRA